MTFTCLRGTVRAVSMLLVAGVLSKQALAAAPLPDQATPSVAPAELVGMPITTRTGQRVSADQVREAQLFWRNFRQALLEGHKQKLASMTRLPLVVRGLTDDQPSRRVGKSKLVSTLKTVLAQEVYPTHAANDSPQPLRKLVEMTPVWQPMHWSSAKQVRLESLAFAKDASGWKLVTVYDEAP